MKNIFTKLIHLLIMAAMAAGVFSVSFMYEANVLNNDVILKSGQIFLKTTGSEKVSVNRSGKEMHLGVSSALEVGDIIESGQSTLITVGFSGDGEMRLDQQTRVLVSFSNSGSQMVFKLLEGRVWVNNFYTNTDVNLVLDGGVLLMDQSVAYAKVNDGRSEVYTNQHNSLLAVVSVDYNANKFLQEDGSEVVNKLYLPEGTAASVFASKVKENQSTIAKLLFSKMVKEFGYSVFDKTNLSTDQWLSDNIEKDISLTAIIRDTRLKKIHTRGLKYSSLEAANYKVDQSMKDLANSLTFSDEKVGQRNLDSLYDLLYDAQYLFDYGRREEAKERLETFNSLANQLFIVYGDDLKHQYRERVRNEYEYLSFANPSDSLFELKQVLGKIYLDSIKGEKDELAKKFAFLTEQITALGYYAEYDDFKNIKSTFDQYMISFKDLTSKYQKELMNNNTFIQRQNQALDNLFIQYANLYRIDYFRNKLFVENKYLSLLPSGNDKPEEIQSVIAQRIDFLRRLQEFFLDGDVPLIDAQNILDLLFSEIAKIELPQQYQVAVSGLFSERLQDYGIFDRFLKSPEYVNSKQRGSTPRQRFEAFKADNQISVSIEDLREELTGTNIGTNNYEIGKIVPEETVPTAPVVNEELVTSDIDGTTTVTENQVDTSTTKVPRVKRPQ